MLIRSSSTCPICKGKKEVVVKNKKQICPACKGTGQKTILTK